MERSKDRIYELVKKKYTGIATGDMPLCCGGQSPSLAGITNLGRTLEYSEEDLLIGPGEANLGLGCGNPTGIAELKDGETVLDLGSGAGFDVFLAAGRVGESGKVIGVDMTPEMIDRARANGERLDFFNVEFRLGKMEKLPAETDSIDVVISNCVINLSPDKAAVFGEIYRSLKPGGRLCISDILRSGEIPQDVMDNPAAYAG